MDVSRMMRSALVGTALTASTLALLALVGWIFDVAVLRAIVPGAVSMKRITVAALLLLASAALLSLVHGRFALAARALRVAAATAALAIGVLTVAEWTFGRPLGIDTLLGPDDGTSPIPGRMAGNTAFAVAGIALAELALLRRRRWASRIASGGAVVALALAFIGIMGYLAGIPDLAAVGSFSVMAAPTALGLMALSMGTLLRSAEASGWMMMREETAQARIARGMLFAVGGLPLAIGLLHFVLDAFGASDVSIRWTMTFAAYLTLFSLVGVTVRAMQRAAVQERSVLEGVRGQAIYVLDDRGRVTSWNPGAEEMTGYRLTEVRGRTLEHLFLPEERHRMAEELAQAARQGQHETEGWRVRKDGTRFWVSATITAIRDADGTVRGYAKVARDRTAERQALDALARSKERYDLAFDASNDGIWDWDLQTNKVTFSARWKSMLGYEPHEIGNDVETWRTLVHSEDLARAERLVEEYLAGKVPRYELEHRMRHKDGAYRWILSRGIAVRDAQGRAYRFVGSHTDITARKSAEEEVRRLNASLEERVLERTAELEAANRELEAFAYSVSHDLRAPLRAIDGFSRVIVEDYYEKLDEEGKDALSRVRAASQRMGSLIDDILRLSRVSRAEIRRETVDISALAAELTAEMRRVQPDRHVETVIEPGLTAVGDPILLRAVLQNFLDNAWKFTSKHEVAHIEVGSKPTPSGPAIYVRDDGAGFDPRYAEKLFGAFQRLHHPTEFPGNGIGLATVKRIIQRHGGTVWAEGEVERGATFSFTLPNRDDRTWQDPPHPSSSSRTTQTTRSSA